AATLSLAPAGAQADATPTGSLSGDVYGYSSAVSPVPVAGVIVTATATGVSESTSTAADGSFTLAGLPPGTYSVAFTPASEYQADTQSGVQIQAGTETDIEEYLQPLPGSVTGVIADQTGAPLYGFQVEAIPAGVTCPTGEICGQTGTSGADGAYTIADLSAGAYQIDALDGSTAIVEASVTVDPGAVVTVDARLPATSVPAGTIAHDAGRDLRYFNAERRSFGLPAGIVLSQRWSVECAAHDTYERDNGVLEHPENPALRGASAGGAWAGLHSVLAEGALWTRAQNPWFNAPIHLIQLLSPSLAVIGIDDSDGFQCATTWPGMLGTPARGHDEIFTYPGAGKRNVPPAEDALESPFVPGQFVGIREGTTAGRELFVYLNQAGIAGQASVHILHARLTAHSHAVRLRWVDNTTRTLGPYLSGGILIPVRPLHGRTRYTASVTVMDGSGTLSHTWSFVTART
ncbi:MAG: carboxypeptidase regulatory-like domain-containing protein, partial [Solirubrobacteraceae bacterium]